MHETLTHPIGLGTISGQKFEHGRISHQGENKNEQQQRESRQTGKDARRRKVDVPLLAVVRGIEHVETTLAEKIAPPRTYSLQEFHRIGII